MVEWFPSWKLDKKFLFTLSFILSGAPASRAKELSDAVCVNIFKYVSMMMFEQHFLLLQLLVTLERLRLSKKASNKELGIFLNGFDKQGLEEASLLEQKPDWMEPQVISSLCWLWLILN